MMMIIMMMMAFSKIIMEQRAGIGLARFDNIATVNRAGS